jgi:transposase-like protein
MKIEKALEPDEINLITLAQQYADDDKARELFESIRWPNGPVCPHCKSKEPYRIVGKKGSKSPTRKGVWKCKTCRKAFTATVGTVLEGSHIPISKWMMTFFILGSSKKGISAHQIHRMVGVTYKTAWFLCHRVRYAMGTGAATELLKGVVETDETYVGGKPAPGTGTAGRGTKHKVPVVALVQRGGDVRTKVVAGVSKKNLRPFVEANIDKSATVNTDEFPTYEPLFKDWARHDTVNHNEKEYARHNADGTVSHTNTAESFFSLLKRGVYGAFHHVSKEHLPKYCEEFSFRWNHRKVSDGQRMVEAVKMVEGKRLTYRQVV